MGVDTHGKIKGFVRPEEVFNFIRQKWDKNATNGVDKRINCPISECSWKYEINEHSEDNENWYTTYGFICFKYKEEDRMLFYHYDNLNSFENLEYYSKYGLEDMVRTETTYLSLGCWGSSVEIIRELVAHFGGGWLDENDCDNKEYYPIELKEDGSIKPVEYVTMEDIYEKFGCVVVISR